jgi:hypothetical protein
MPTMPGAGTGAPAVAPAVDTDKMVRIMDAKIAATANERHRRNLETVREHMNRERLLDPEGVVGTLSPEANYKLWVDGVDLGAKGLPAIREWYVDTNIRQHRTFVIEYDLERVVVDDDVVVTEGQMNVVVDAAYVSEVLGIDCDPDDIMLHSFRQIVFWPVDADSKLLGEEFYTSGSGNPKALRKLAPDEIPGDWHALVKLSHEI